MDPLSIAGIGLGAVSLTLQLFANCIKGLDLLVSFNLLLRDNNSI